MSFVPATQAPANAPHGRSVWYCVNARGLLARRELGTNPARWSLPSADDLADLGLDATAAHVLGHDDGTVSFAVSVRDDFEPPDGWSLLGLRSLVEAFDPATFAIAGRASHVLDWSTTSRFCGRCGTATRRDSEERCMRCPSCSLTIYPRIAPAVIVLVRRGDEALLARNASFPVPFFSTLAGFSEIGEALEETVHREIFEEVGVRVKDVRYFGSQPWPFPNSLMLGFVAEWESGAIVVDAKEIVEARWFSARALPLVPPRMSIARRLIDAWVAEVT